MSGLRSFFTRDGFVLFSARQMARVIRAAGTAEFDALMHFYRNRLSGRTQQRAVHVSCIDGVEQIATYQRFWWSQSSDMLLPDLRASHDELADNGYLHTLVRTLARLTARSQQTIVVTFFLKRYQFGPGIAGGRAGIRGHRDGCRLLFTQLLEAQNVTGAANQVIRTRRARRDADVLVPASLPEVLSGCALDDRRLFHRLLPMHAVDDNRPAIRTILVCRIDDDGSADP